MTESKEPRRKSSRVQIYIDSTLREKLEDVLFPMTVSAWGREIIEREIKLLLKNNKDLKGYMEMDPIQQSPIL